MEYKYKAGDIIEAKGKYAKVLRTEYVTFLHGKTPKWALYITVEDLQDNTVNRTVKTGELK